MYLATVQTVGTAFTIGGWSIQWYGIIIAAALLAGIGITMAMLKRKGMDPDSVLDLALAQSLCAEEPVLRVCKNCGKIYYNPHARSEFCSVRCRNQYNVRAWRSRQRENV